MVKFSQDRFDTGILGKNIFKLHLKKPVRSSSQLTALFKNNKIDIIFCFSIFSNKNISVLEKLEFNFISIRNTYKFLPKQGVIAHRLNSPFKLFQNSKNQPAISDHDILKMAATIGSKSRYFQDKRIPKKKAQKIYTEWIKNSLYHNYANESFVIMKGNRLVGLITLKIKNRIGYIDLIGVNKKYQNLGLGSLLVQSGMEYFRNKKVENICVVTEGENVQANIFYQKKGFVVSNVELVYHKHF